MLGAIFATAISGFIASYLGWQGIFYIFGILAVIASFAVFLKVFDSPTVHPTISLQEKNMILDSLQSSDNYKTNVSTHFLFIFSIGSKQKK